MLLFLLFNVTFVGWNCTKESPSRLDQVINNEVDVFERDETTYYYEYFLDGVSVNSVTTDTTTDNWIAYLVYPIANTDDATVKVYKFSTKAGYIQFGVNNNLAIGKGLQVAEHLHHIADSSGVIAEYELFGTIPQWYIDYQDNYYNTVFLQGKAEERNFIWSLFKSCESGGGMIPMINAYPFMPPTWNDKVSRVQNVGIYSGISIFDRRFFFKHLGTIWLFGFQNFCLGGTAADKKMSSGLKII